MKASLAWWVVIVWTILGLCSHFICNRYFWANQYYNKEATRPQKFTVFDLYSGSLSIWVYRLLEAFEKGCSLDRSATVLSGDRVVFQNIVWVA